MRHGGTAGGRRGLGRGPAAGRVGDERGRRAASSTALTHEIGRHGRCDARTDAGGRRRGDRENGHPLAKPLRLDVGLVEHPSELVRLEGEGDLVAGGRPEQLLQVGRLPRDRDALLGLALAFTLAGDVEEELRGCARFQRLLDFRARDVGGDYVVAILERRRIDQRRFCC